MSENNEYPKYYRKAIKGSVGGRILDKKGNEAEFLLKGDPYDENTDLDNLTVEIIDADSEKYFRKANKPAIVNGYLIQVSDYELTLDEVNAVSDGYLKDLLKESFTKMKKRVEEFTSPVPVNRLLVFAKADNKPVKTISYLEEKLKEFNPPVKLPDRIIR
jgi:hypothetical protein